jgi:hypothetical protein
MDCGAFHPGEPSCFVWTSEPNKKDKQEQLKGSNQPEVSAINHGLMVFRKRLFVALSNDGHPSTPVKSHSRKFRRFPFWEPSQGHAPQRS